MGCTRADRARERAANAFLKPRRRYTAWFTFGECFVLKIYRCDRGDFIARRTHINCTCATVHTTQYNNILRQFARIGWPRYAFHSSGFVPLLLYFRQTAGQRKGVVDVCAPPAVGSNNRCGIFFFFYPRAINLSSRVVPIPNVRPIRSWLNSVRIYY